MADELDPRERAQFSAAEFFQWLKTHPNAGAGLHTGGIFPALASYKLFSDVAHRLAESVEHYDRSLAGRPVRDVGIGCEILRDLCDALHTLWNVGDVGNDAPGDLLLEYIEIEGYGHHPTTQEIPNYFRDIAEALEAIGTKLRFVTNGSHHWGPLLWEWRLRSPQRGLWSDVEAVDADGELLAWWAPPDALDEAAAALGVERFPDSSLFWESVREAVDRQCDSYSAEACLKIMSTGDETIPNERDRLYQQAIAVEWTRRRREWTVPRRDAFLWEDFRPVTVDVGWFDTDAECWPRINDEICEISRSGYDGPGNNIFAFASLAYVHLRHTDAGRSQLSEEELEDYEERKRAAIAEIEAGADAEPMPILRLAEPSSVTESEPPSVLEATSNETRAIALFLSDPHKFKSMSEVAETLGLHRGTVSRMQKFKAVWRSFKIAQSPPRGTKSRDGRIESESD